MHQHDVERQAACQLSVTYEQRNTWTAALTGTIQDFRVIIRNKAVFFWLLSRRPLFFHSHAYQTVKRYVFYKNANKDEGNQKKRLKWRFTWRGAAAGGGSVVVVHEPNVAGRNRRERGTNWRRNKGEVRKKEKRQKKEWTLSCGLSRCWLSPLN